MLKQNSRYSKLLKFVFLVVVFCFNTGYTQNPVVAKKGIVVSTEKLASAIGRDILSKGGNAIDAAVATGFALAVTYPAAGNIGGGGYMVIHLKNGEDIFIDYREKAPLKSKSDMYLNSKGDAVDSLSQENTSSAAVPGSVAGLIYALNKYGTMKLADVIQPAIDLAQNGFIVTKEFSNSLKKFASFFDKYPSSKKIFLKENGFYGPGETFYQKELAHTLSLIKRNGLDGFYKGETAKLIVNQMQNGGGIISLTDLETYKPIEKKALTGTYRGYKVVSAPPSSSGGTALLQTLNILENFKLNSLRQGSPEYVHLIVETLKRVYADRAEHLGDPDFTKVPVDWLISKEYASQISKTITDKCTSSKDIKHGVPPVTTKESTETTHYSVADNMGNAVSTTTTINSVFGSKVVVEGAGFLLNNEMDDFSAKPGSPNQFGLVGGKANSIQPNKRMLSSMTPTIVLKNDKPYIVIGSPGGSTIITTVLQVILDCIDFKKNIRQAVDAPRFHHQWLPDRIDYEKDVFSKITKKKLLERGHILGKEVSLGLAEGIMIYQSKNIFTGWSDSRGYGLAVGF